MDMCILHLSTPNVVDDGSKPSSGDENKVDEDSRKDSEGIDQEKENNVKSTNNVNAASTNEVNVVGGKTSIELPFDPNMPALEDYRIFDLSRNDEDDSTKADINNLDTTIQVSPIPTIRIHKDHPLDQVIGDFQLAPQTRRMSDNLEEHGRTQKGNSCIEGSKLDRGYARRASIIQVQEVLDFVVDDIIFGSTKKELCNAFEKLMYEKFQMSSMGELIFFLGLQVQQKEDVCACARYQVNPKVSHLYDVKRIFSDYVGASLDRKSTTGGCQFLGCRLISWKCKKQTVVANSTTEAEYVVASSCLLECSIFKVVEWNGKSLFRMELELMLCLSPKSTAWNEFGTNIASAIICLATNQMFNFSKLIFDGMIRNLDDASSKFLMYPRFVQLFLEKQTANLLVHKKKYTTSFHTKKIFANMKRIGRVFSGNVTPLSPSMVVQNQSQMGEGSAIPTDPQHTPTFIPSTSQPQKTQKPRKHKRQDTKIPQFSGPTEHVADEVVYKERDDRLATPNEPSSLGTSSAGGPRRQETMGDTIAQTRFENVSKLSNDPLLARVIDLEKTKTSQAQEITSLKRRVKRLEKKGGSRTHRLKRLYKVGLSRRVESSDEEGLGEEDASKQGRIADIDADAGINLVSTHFDADTNMFGVHDLVGDEVVVESEVTIKVASIIPVSAATTTTTIITDDEITLAKALAALKSVSDATTTTTVITNDEITLAKALAELKSAKLPTTTAATTITAASTRPKAKGIVIHEQEQAPTPTVSSQQPSQLNVQDKGKGKMVEPEPVKKLSKKDQLMLDEELAFKLQAEEEEEERLAKEKAQQIKEVNIAWDDVQARVKADYHKKRKHFAAKRAEEKRNRPPTRAQQRSFMCTYLKNMEGWKPKDLKNKSFVNIQELFDKAIKRVNTFVDYRTELVEESSKKAKAEIAQESSSKRAGTELEQENIKKQKVDEDKETTKLQRPIEIVLDKEEVAIDAIPFTTKPPSIVDYKIHKEGKKTYYQIIRADGSSKLYLVFSHMLKSFDMENLETLWKLVKAKHGSTRPDEGYERVLWGDLKTMFDPHVEDQVWRKSKDLQSVGT
ncbi:hypothetical protein Tco_0705447 [Tanacetum coccineum]|uniref:Uncharacterized protein n=1 Tax=Tanacetum coccineum TaxID=301880 RepID=A0ABQ4Y5I6_9ASTR